MLQLLSAHLLDGMLGRAFALFAVAMLCGIYLWRHYFRLWISTLNKLTSVVVLIGLCGVALSLNSTFFQLADAGGEGASLPWQQVMPLLVQTSYGRYWIGFSLLLMFAWRTVNHGHWLLLSIVGMMLCLGMNSHASDTGSAMTLALHMVHVACVLIWWGGLMMIMLGRVAQICAAERPTLQAFSSLILPVFLLGLVTGGLRLASAFFENGALSSAYWMLVAVKGGLVLAVMLCAWRLRVLLQPVVFNDNSYDDGVSLEFFFAVLLLLAAAMLTQLPPL